MLVLLLCSFKPAHSSSVDEIEILIPVDLYKLPQGLTLVGSAPKEIELRVKGPPAVLDDLKHNAPRYKLDLSGVAVGSESIAVNLDLLKMPAEAQITQVNPAYLTIKVDRLLKKRVQVKVAVSGEPDGRYFINDMLTRPSTILICGPETAVGFVDEIFTKPIDVTGRSESFKKEIFKSYFVDQLNLFSDLTKKFQSSLKRKKEIENEAENQRTQWEEVIDIITVGDFYAMCGGENTQIIFT